MVVGTPIANRQREEMAGLIGFFVNTLPLRVNFSGDPTVIELLALVRAATAGACAHQDVPFDLVVEQQHPARSLHRTPVFQVLFVFENIPTSSLRLGDVTVRPFDTIAQAAKFDSTPGSNYELTLVVKETAECFSCTVWYNGSLFKADRIERMMGHLQILLEAMVRNPEIRISELPVLTDSERTQQLVDWNQTETAEYPSARCIHELFEQQVERTPQAIALAFDGVRLTYRETNDRANQLAQYLRRRGVGPEVRVGICIERSIEMVVAVLGVLKAGGAYVPLDAEYPAERLAYMLEDAQTALLLTQETLLERFAAQRAPVVCLDREWETIGRESTANPDAQCAPENLAYVIYTSGSTGRPKGVAVAHRGVVNLAHTQMAAFGLNASSRVLQFASLSFDASVSEWVTALLSGARLVLAARNTLIADLMNVLQAEAITVVTLPPSVLGTLPSAWLEDLSTLVVAGEACPAEMIARWAPRRRMLNAYGPTETTVCATISSALTPEGDYTIGRPISNTTMYVLDARMEPSPVGVAGELYIGGAGLARGYLNRPDLTAERFVPDPFSGRWGARLYRSGDLGRWRSDGTLEFIGRADEQVKVHGYRIEPGEIEAALLQVAGIEQAAVVAREESGSGKRLVAYLSGPEPRPAVSELRQQLKRILPEYMIPASFVFLNRLPVTSNGKLDRSALPAPDQSRPNLEGLCIAPRTPVEETLAGIWRELLQVDRVGIEDNFFELGGHSLLLTQLIWRVGGAFGVELSLPEILDIPTFKKLTELIMERQVDAQADSGSSLLLEELSQMSIENVDGDFRNEDEELLRLVPGEVAE